MSKKTELIEPDSTFFDSAMQGVKPIKNTKVQLKSPAPKPIRMPQQTTEPEADLFSDFESELPVSGEEILQFSRPGIQHKILRNLRNGKYNIEATLDLHGMTVVEAQQAASRFLLKCQRHDIRHVLVIHGKGRGKSKPILKNKLNNWLRQTGQVLAFCSATNREGRTGALYVLLKAPHSSSEK